MDVDVDVEVEREGGKELKRSTGDALLGSELENMMAATETDLNVRKEGVWVKERVKRWMT